ncbi:hypothetical protein CSV79_11685 [Sporosarcina sp. P13]|uniref:hypothetical protein n=1 Tax=Sporosarcina sp. P13 TaxID=2048263 RepID=UPI000C16AA18|nr:hypothetical protein [Sporosarcina sp. P13]PIC63449.1 hypothetical protein CSV79_11685 [Sporosarcina sp. P13]
MSILEKEPLQFDRALAAKIGFNESIVLQQLHALLLDSEDMEGQQWVCKSYNAWRVQFPFWSVDTIKRTIKKLEKAGYIHSKRVGQKEKWYSVNYETCTTEAITLLPVYSDEKN